MNTNIDPSTYTYRHIVNFRIDRDYRDAAAYSVVYNKLTGAAYHQFETTSTLVFLSNNDALKFIGNLHKHVGFSEHDKISVVSINQSILKICTIATNFQKNGEFNYLIDESFNLGYILGAKEFWKA